MYVRLVRNHTVFSAVLSDLALVRFFARAFDTLFASFFTFFKEMIGSSSESATSALILGESLYYGT